MTTPEFSVTNVDRTSARHDVGLEICAGHREATVWLDRDWEGCLTVTEVRSVEHEDWFESHHESVVAFARDYAHDNKWELAQ